MSLCYKFVDDCFLSDKIKKYLLPHFLSLHSKHMSEKTCETGETSSRN